MNIQNPSELRAAIADLVIEDGNANIGGVIVARQELLDAADELIGSLVDAYMDGKKPTACAALLGRILLNELDAQLST